MEGSGLATGEGGRQECPSPLQDHGGDGQGWGCRHCTAAGRLHVCKAACARKQAFLWEVRAEGVWSAWWRGSLWAPVSGWPGVSGCVQWGVAGPHEAGENCGSQGEVSFQLQEGEFNISM